MLSIRFLLNNDFNRTHLVLFSQTILTIPSFITMCHETSHKVKKNENLTFKKFSSCFLLKTFQMVCQKDIFHHLICIFSIKESFVSISGNIDIIELCYMLGN